jgi:tetratricopeptide (TPR) repeat protein
MVVVIGGLGLTGWHAWSWYRSTALWQEALAASRSRAWDRVETTLTRRAWYRPEDPVAILLRVEAALRRGDREAAARALAAVPDSSPQAESAHLSRGRLLKELYRPAEAIEEFRACLRLNPRQIAAHRELIIIFGIERRAGEQEAELWALHDCAGGAVEALRILGQSTLTIPPGALAKTADEGSVLQRCLETRPDDPDLVAPLAYFLRNRGEVAAARALLERWLGTSAERAGIRLEDLACLLDQGDIASARPWFEASDERLESSSRYWLLRGDWFRLQDHPRETVESYQEAVRRDPRNPEIRYRLAQALRATRRDHEADLAMSYHQRLQQLSLLTAQISESAPDLDRLIQAARLCHDLDRDREARAWYTAALCIAPSHQEAQRFLGEIGAPGGVAGAAVPARDEKRGVQP